MDTYEATRVVFSRIQSLDQENAAKIMGLLLIQDHGEKEMIRLAFGPESLLQTVVVGARKELGLLEPSSPMAAANARSNTAAATAAAANDSTSSFLLRQQNSSSRLLGGGGGGLTPLSVSSPTSWTPPLVFSRSRSGIGNGGLDGLQGSSEDFVSPSNPGASPFYGTGVSCGSDLIDEFQLQEQLTFLNDGTSNTSHGLQIPQKDDLFYPDMPGECRSPGGIDGVGMFPYGMGSWGGHHRRSCSAADMYLGSDVAAGLGWKPCLYFARGYCKNGTSCRFLHGLPDDNAVAAMCVGGKIDAATAVEQPCQEFLLRSKSQRQLMASTFPYSPTSSLPSSPSGANKCINFLLQSQNESQRAAAAAAVLIMNGADDGHKFLGRSRMMERSDFALAMSNPGSRQIYLTFPADSTFKEEDVSNYFSIYGPVQDVRIPYQQKRMFGFVTFVYPETVKLILAKGNPHFVCDARVLVKPYKEKGKVPDKKQQLERGDLSGCTTPTGLDLRDPFELPPLGGRTLYNNNISQEALLKRKLEEQQEAAELQHAIELQSRRLMGLHLLDLKNRNQFSPNTSTVANICISSPTTSMAPRLCGQESINSQEDKKSNPATVVASAAAPAVTADPQQGKTSRESPVNATAAADADEADESSAGEATPKEVISFPESSLEHNLPDSPFALPTKSSSFVGDAFSYALATQENSAAAPTCLTDGNHLVGSTSFPSTSTRDVSSFNPCFFQMPRFSSDHGAVEM